MRLFAIYITIGFFLLIIFPSANAANCDCCSKMGGVHYCDSSAGRFVCNNGYYSDCYCDRHAVMDLQLLRGCCLWQGGVFKLDPLGLVICNDGGVSNVCSTQLPVDKITLEQ